jgi:dienelactone hydrolase
MQSHYPLLCFFAVSLMATDLQAQVQPKVPGTVKSLWKDVDLRKDPLQVQTVREWEKEGIVYRYVTFHIGTFKGKPARMAAFFGFPKGGKKLPGLLHLHGGGQRAFLREVEFYAKRGYACLSINWGGREMENAKPNDLNTDWGAVDPTQKNVPGYFNLKPGKKYLDAFESPRNNNWYLLTLGSRRGLTFLERQKQVDQNRLGVYGHSMGGNLTVYVAGTDERVKVAAPSVGGQGFRTVPWKLLPEQRRRVPKGDMKLFRATLGFQSYAPHIKAPLLWLSATNDFHEIMDDTYRTGVLIPHKNVRYSFTPHMNHRFTPAFAVARPLWIDQHLKGGLKLPATPDSKFLLAADDGVPVFQVTPKTSQPVAKVNIFYSIDPDPQARFWRSAEVKKDGRVWKAKLPILSVDQPLFVFANVHYRLQKPQPVPFARPTSTFAISSMLHTATSEQLKKAGTKATDQPSSLIDDFTHGYRDWYLLSAENPHHWQFWTRKITDPKWRGASGSKLAFDVKTDKPNRLIVVVTENFFRSYRGKNGDFVAVVSLKGSGDWESVTLIAADFKSVKDSSPLKSWKHADLLGFRAYYSERRGTAKFGSMKWAGSRPVFRKLRWNR